VPVRTSRRPRSRAASYRPHRTGRGRVYRSSARRAWLVRKPAVLWLALGALAALAISIPFLGPRIADAVEELLGLLGLGLPLVAAAIAADLRLALRPPALSRAFWRRWGSLHLLLLFTIGLAGLFKPGWQLGDVSFAEVSGGGDLGRLFVNSALGLLVWAALGLTGLGLLWPRGARRVGRGGLAALKFLASLHIPQKVSGAIGAFFVNLLPQAEEKTRAPREPLYLPQWDEEWGETLPELEGSSAPAGLAEALEQEKGDEPPLVIGGAGQEPYQRPLSMGRPAGHGWELPPVDLLAETSDVELRPLDNEVRAQLIVDTLASLGVNARVVSISQGPTITQFGLEPGWETKTRTVALRDEHGRPLYDKEGRPQVRTEVISRTRVRVNRITALANDLALALAAPSIRIEAPVPGKPVIGIEVPNTTTSLVALRSVIESSAFQRVLARSKLAIALGKGVSGEPAAADLTKMPHLLIAGATGSGKSVCINSVIAGLLLHNTPEDLRLVLIDPKRVELATFAHIPHLAFSKIITDGEEVVATLQAVIHEMDSRYRRFASIGVRNIEAYNKSPRAPYKLAYWVVIIDELADLMMAAPYQVERQICRLAQLARATGIHLVIATQRPSVDVVTGLIKANFPTRIAFAVSSQVDSRTIIDGAGAEKLLGRGDMLFMPTDASKPKRLQGCYVSDQELDRVVAWWANDRFRHLRPEAMDHLLEEARAQEDKEGEGGEEDPLFEAAKELASQHSRISTSLLQRRLHIGYPRAARLIDLLEQEGIVGPAEGGHSRQVLLGQEGDDRFE